MAKKISIFESYYEAARDLPAEDFKKFFTAIFEKAFYDNNVELEGLAKTMFTLVKPILEKSLQLSAIRSEAGKLGGRPTKANEKQTESKSKANRKQTESKPKADKDKDKEKEKEKEKEKKTEVASARFVKPTLEEVADYCRQRNNGIDAESFIAFYESKGWKIGTSPMKNWKAAIITWENRRKNDTKQAKVARNSFSNFEQQRHYSSSELSELERKLLAN